MKRLLLALPTVLLLGACTEYHYDVQPTRTVTRTVDRPVYHSTAPRKAAPSVSGEAAEGFQAVEKPGSYSQ